MKSTVLSFIVLTIITSCFVCCCHQNNGDIGTTNSRCDITGLVINYSPVMHPYDLSEYITADDFLSDPDLRNISIDDSSILALFQKVITSTKKDTIRKIIIPQDPPVVIFDPSIGDSVMLQLGEENEVYYYWENGPSACYVVELQTESGADTLIIPNSPSIVQYNNTVFNDSTLFYTVTALISENDAEWAKGHFRESQNRDDCPVYRYKYENTPTGDITFLQQ